MKRFFVLTLIALSAGVPADNSVVKNDVDGYMLLVDRSGSMWGTMGSVKSTIKEITSRAGNKAPMGLVHFSGCEDENVVYDPQYAAGTRDRVNEVVQGLEPNGLTALVKALKIALREMQALKQCPQLILFTDYGETCDANLSGIISELQNYCIEISVITATTEDTVVKDLSQLAEKTGGTLHTVTNYQDRLKALDEIFQRNEKRKKAFGKGGAYARKVGAGATGGPDDPKSPEAKAREKLPATLKKTETKEEVPKP